MVVGNDVLREALVLLVDRIIVLAVIINRAQKTCDLAASYALDVRTWHRRNCSEV